MRFESWTHLNAVGGFGFGNSYLKTADLRGPTFRGRFLRRVSAAESPSGTASEGNGQNLVVSRVAALPARKSACDARALAKRRIERQIHWSELSMYVGLVLGTAAVMVAATGSAGVYWWPLLVGAFVELVFVPLYTTAARRRIQRRLTLLECEDRDAAVSPSIAAQGKMGEIRFSCPHCRTRFCAQRNDVGRTFKCPIAVCQQPIKIEARPDFEVVASVPSSKRFSRQSDGTERGTGRPASAKQPPDDLAINGQVLSA